MERRYVDAKADLSKIEFDNYTVEYNDNLEYIMFNSKIKSNGFYINRERFKYMSVLILFLILPFFVAAWLFEVNINLQYIVYIFAIALIIALLGTLTKEIKVKIAFRQKHITRNASKLAFADVKQVYIDEYTVRLVKVTMLMLRTKQGKIDFLLFPISGEKEKTQEQLFAWCNDYLNK